MILTGNESLPLSSYPNCEVRGITCHSMHATQTEQQLTLCFSHQLFSWSCTEHAIHLWQSMQSVQQILHVRHFHCKLSEVDLLQCQVMFLVFHLQDLMRTVHTTCMEELSLEFLHLSFHSSGFSTSEAIAMTT